jgi:phosphopantetheine adenylyltransferase
MGSNRSRTTSRAPETRTASMVRELLAFSKDVSPYVPESVLRLVEK